tara:strand:+ start:2629 stop:3483 length:855 start_codon:yes stop_codon:yes gene_type:complete
MISVYGCTSKELNNNKLSEGSETVIKIEGVAALGKLNPLGDVRKLAAPTSGKGGTPRIFKLLVEEGDYIVSNQILAIFDNRSKLEADLAVEIAKSNILTNQLNIQKRELIRYQALVSNKAVPVINLEEIEDEIVILKGKKEQILSSINAIKIDLEQTQLKSPINGVVLQILAREGERPDSSGVLKVGANQLMEALIEVYESDIDRVKTGQEVDLISENGGFKGSLKGKVSLISPQVRQRRVLSTDPTGDADSRVIEVRVKLDNVSAKMVSHLTGMKVIARFKPE